MFFEKRCEYSKIFPLGNPPFPPFPAEMILVTPEGGR
jgi:hypothetical protein